MRESGFVKLHEGQALNLTGINSVFYSTNLLSINKQY